MLHYGYLMICVDTKTSILFPLSGDNLSCFSHMLLNCVLQLCYVHKFCVYELYILLCIEKPSPVDQLTVTDIRSRGVSLSWRLTDDGNSAILKYTIQYCKLKGELLPHYTMLVLHQML